MELKLENRSRICPVPPRSKSGLNLGVKPRTIMAVSLVFMLTNRVEIERLSTRYGIAKGYCAAYDTDTYIFYSPKIGLQIWYEHERACGSCEMEDQCLRTLQTLAEEWEIPLSDD
ncbi:MAG: hypothetical protein ACFFCX_09270, partial [Candidatus Sifarchaeia archaeon]